jgi:hypothetical protein
MPLPDFDHEGYLPPGLHAAPLAEVLTRLGVDSAARQRQAELLRQVVEAAIVYPTIKRVLVWGSFVTTKPEPGDLDYSIVVSVMHKPVQIAAEHRRFFVPFDAHMHYGVDRGYLVIFDYPLETYVEQVDFLCQTRSLRPCGIVEISLRGEVIGEG